MTAPGLADCASVHAPVCAGNNGDFERLGFYKTTKADTAERADAHASVLILLAHDSPLTVKVFLFQAIIKAHV